jgi:signal transduction histidine kinase
MIKQFLISILFFIPLIGWSINNIEVAQVTFEDRIKFHINQIDSIKAIEPINWGKINGIELTLSSLYRNIGQYTKAMNAALEGVRIAETYRGGEGLLASYQDVANSLRYKGNFKEAHIYMRKAIDGSKKFKDEKKKKVYLAYFYYQHTLIFQEEGLHLDSALFYHKITLDLREQLGKVKDIPSSHMGIGYIHYLQGNNKKALASLILADTLYDSIKQETRPNAWLRKKAKINNYLGLVYYSSGNLSKAIKHFKASSETAENIIVKNIQLSSYKNLGNCYEQLNLMDSALIYRNKFITLNESVFDEQKNQQIEELKTVYETKEKNKIISNQTKEISSNKKKIAIFIIALITLLVLIIFIAVFARIKRLKSEKDIQSKFSQDLINTIEKDRERISRDLHDSIGQNLLIIKNQNSLLKLKLDQKLLLEKSDSINKYAAQTIDELREISNNLVPYQLGRLGLTKAVINLIEKVENTTEINCIKDISNIDNVVDQNLQINIFRIIQESLNNIIKHSKATEIKFEISPSKIVIKDNGVGFVTSKTSNGMGLSNLVERAKLLNAEFHIDSSPNAGTKITLQFSE